MPNEIPSETPHETRNGNASVSIVGEKGAVKTDRLSGARLFRYFVGALMIPLAIAIGPVAAVAAGFVTSSSLNRLSLVFVISIASAALMAALVGFVSRKLLRSRRLVVPGVCAFVAATLVTVTGVAVANEEIPMTVVSSRSIPNVEMWKLSTGSTVAGWRLPSIGGLKKGTPVVFLHGGPGMFITQSNLDAGAVLRSQGFDTIYFDQAGSGASANLKISEMSADRSVADIEALRKYLGVNQLVLWGQSAGATMAAAYVEAHPDNVAGLILFSPGALPGAQAERDFTKTARGSDEGLSSRLALTVALIDQNPQLAEQLTSQVEAGALFDQTVNVDLISGGYCLGKLPSSREPVGGGNVFVNRLISTGFESGLTPHSHPKVMTLIVRGSCDFIESTVAQRYADLFGTNTTVTAIDQAGHGLHENPTDRDAAMTTFAIRLADVVL